MDDVTKYSDTDYSPDENDSNSQTKSELKDETNITDIEKSSNVSSGEINIANLEYEYRDEANRKWYKILDEKEYRINKEIKSE